MGTFFKIWLITLLACGCGFAFAVSVYNRYGYFSGALVSLGVLVLAALFAALVTAFLLLFERLKRVEEKLDMLNTPAETNVESSEDEAGNPS